MTNLKHPIGEIEPGTGPEAVEMPRPTVAPLVLSLGLALVAAGWVTSLALVAAGGTLVFAGLTIWAGQLLPGRGHCWEPLVAGAHRPRPVTGAHGSVEQMHAGRPGYRLRLPEHVHPISAGVKGGIVGGLVMPLPALMWGVATGHGLWYPVNLLAGMALPGVGAMSDQQLEEFLPTLFMVAVAIHAVMAVVMGLIYGVLMPMLPAIPKPLALGALLMPICWTGASYGLMGLVNPLLLAGVDWRWFIVSQFIFGLVVAIVSMRAASRGPVAAGLIGGLAGGVLMAIPAIVWGLLTGRGIWYPVNLLAGMVHTGMQQLPTEELTRFRFDWWITAVVIHALMSGSFGLLFGLLLPRIRPIPGPLAWGGMLMPLAWTAASYGLMGIVNPVLQKRVDWPWFIVSQFVFGVVAAIVVVRSETVRILPAGRGPDRLSEVVDG